MAGNEKLASQKENRTVHPRHKMKRAPIDIVEDRTAMGRSDQSGSTDIACEAAFRTSRHDRFSRSRLTAWSPMPT